MRYIGSLGIMAAVLFMAEGVGSDAAPEAEATERKSIVPAKYANKYKGGGADDLAKFINDQCKTKPDAEGKGGGEFDFESFFVLCEKNDVPKEQVDKYRQIVADAPQGANGRARMTLRNMLAARVRKAEGKVVAVDGSEHQVAVAKPAVSGAAAKAQEGELQGAAAAATEQSDTADAETEQLSDTAQKVVDEAGTEDVADDE